MPAVLVSLVPPPNASQHIPPKMTSMTPKYLEKLCVEHDGYRTPELNDKLYLHYKVREGGNGRGEESERAARAGARCSGGGTVQCAQGFTKIENLEPYTALRVRGGLRRAFRCVRRVGGADSDLRRVQVLWLEGNALSELSGLSAQRELRSLFVQENLIEEVSGLEACSELVTLNLAQNMVSVVPALGRWCPKLETLNLAHNRLEKLSDVAAVRELPCLSVLDLQENQIAYEEGLVEFFASLPALRVLYLQGNPCVREVRHYRRVLVAACKELRFLDDRPVFEDERLRCEAWQRAMDATDGDVKAAAAAERDEMERQRREKADRDERNFLAFEEMVRNARSEREDKARVAALLDTLEAAGPVTRPVAPHEAADTIRAALTNAENALVAKHDDDDDDGDDAVARTLRDALERKDDEDGDEDDAGRAVGGGQFKSEGTVTETASLPPSTTPTPSSSSTPSSSAHVPSPVAADGLPSLSHMDRVVLAAHRAGMNPFAPGEAILHNPDDDAPDAQLPPTTSTDVDAID
jgi:Leucine rich repeat